MIAFTSSPTNYSYFVTQKVRVRTHGKVIYMIKKDIVATWTHCVLKWEATVSWWLMGKGK